jgi:rhodanese-related sulfurtransferase
VTFLNNFHLIHKLELIMRQKMEKPKKQNLKSPWLLIFIGLALILATGYFLLKPAPTQKTALPSEVSVAEAVKLRDAGAFVLDVRQPEEWEQAHMPGATLIPLGELQARSNEVPKDAKVLVVCRSGNRSQQGREILLAAGFTTVTSMAGGVTQWQLEGNPVVSGP